MVQPIQALLTLWVPLVALLWVQCILRQGGGGGGAEVGGGACRRGAAQRGQRDVSDAMARAMPPCPPCCIVAPIPDNLCCCSAALLERLAPSVSRVSGQCPGTAAHCQACCPPVSGAWLGYAHRLELPQAPSRDPLTRLHQHCRRLGLQRRVGGGRQQEASQQVGRHHKCRAVCGSAGRGQHPGVVQRELVCTAWRAAASTILVQLLAGVHSSLRQS